MCAPPSRKHEVSVAVALGPYKDDRRNDTEDMPLERQSSVRKCGWWREARQVCNRRRLHRQEMRAILECLDWPALNAAEQSRVGRYSVVGSGGKRRREGEKRGSANGSNDDHLGGA
jgi:hypothetical protein